MVIAMMQTMMMMKAATMSVMSVMLVMLVMRVMFSSSQKNANHISSRMMLRMMFRMMIHFMMTRHSFQNAPILTLDKKIPKILKV